MKHIHSWIVISRSFIKTHLRLVLTLFCGLAYSLRAHEYIRQPQLYAEDGAVWLADAHNLGWQSLAMPLNGFFHLFERLFGYVVTTFPLRLAPLLFCLSGLMLFLAMVSYIFSSRTKLLTGSYQLLFFAATLCLIANVEEFFFNFSNSVFLLGIVGTCLVIADRSSHKAVTISERILFTIICLTLPFCWFYVLLLLARRFIQHLKQNFYLSVALFGSIVQLVVFAAANSQRSSITVRSLISQYSLLEVYNQIIVPALRFTRQDIALSEFTLPALLVVLFSISLVGGASIFVLIKGSARERLFLGFIFAMTIASLKSPIIKAATDTEAIKFMAVAPLGDRYFIFGIIGLCFVMTKFSGVVIRKPFRYWAAAAFFGFGLITSWQHQAFFIRKNFRDLRVEYSNGIEQAQKRGDGKKTKIPINPDGWQIILESKRAKY